MRVSLDSQFRNLEEKLIQNYFSQLEKHNGISLNKIRRASRVFSGETTGDLMQLVDSILDLPKGTYREKFDGYNETLTKLIRDLKALNEEGKNTQRMTQTFRLVQGLCASSYTQINARGVHQATYTFFTQPRLRYVKTEVDDILGDIPEERQTELIKSLARSWSSIKRKSDKLNEPRIVNIPNLAFDLVSTRGGSKINIIRMRSPELCPDEEVIASHYRTMMENYSQQEKRHMDVSLVSLSYFKREIIVSELRHDIQLDYPDTLLREVEHHYR